MPLTKATQNVISPNICTTDTAQTITAAKTFTGNVTTSNLVNGTSLCFRNKIINGNFGINQRGYVSGTATSGANQYTLDRWRVVTSGQNFTFIANSTGNIVTAPTGGIEQVIEGLNIEGGTYTLSWAGTATGAVNGIVIANGGQVTLPSITNATIKFSSGTVSLVQLEAGSVATPFENRPIGTELALCQRYYEKSYNINIAPASGTSVGLAYGSRQNGGGVAYVKFSVTKRSTPAVNIWSATGGSGQVTNVATQADESGTVQDASQSGFNVFPNTITISSAYTFQWASQSEL